LKVTPLGPVHVQAYVRLAGPVSWSPPSTERLVVVPVRGVALAGLLTVGGWLVTVIALVLLTDPLVAVTVPLPDVADAVSTPLALIVPMVVDQVTVGPDTELLNWSLAPVTKNVCVPPAKRLAVDGKTVNVLSVGVTVTLTLLVAVAPPGSVIVTVKRYVPT
jgi:hypothetical protein